MPFSSANIEFVGSVVASDRSDVSSSCMHLVDIETGLSTFFSAGKISVISRLIKYCPERNNSNTDESLPTLLFSP
jgi:hypothetical protein